MSFPNSGFKCFPLSFLGEHLFPFLSSLFFFSHRFLIVHQPSPYLFIKFPLFPLTSQCICCLWQSQFVLGLSISQLLPISVTLIFRFGRSVFVRHYQIERRLLGHFHQLGNVHFAAMLKNKENPDLVNTVIVLES